MGMVRKCFGNVPLKNWTSQSCFSLGFLSQNSLWKLSTFCECKGYLYWSENGMRRAKFFQNKVGWQLGLVTWLSCEFKPQANKIARLDFCPVVLQLAWLFIISACFTRMHHLAVCQLRVLVTSPCFTAQSWAFLRSLTHYPYMIPT